MANANYLSGRFGGACFFGDVPGTHTTQYNIPLDSPSSLVTPTPGMLDYLGQGPNNPGMPGPIKIPAIRSGVLDISTIAVVTDIGGNATGFFKPALMSELVGNFDTNGDLNPHDIFYASAGLGGAFAESNWMYYSKCTSLSIRALAQAGEPVRVAMQFLALDAYPSGFAGIGGTFADPTQAATTLAHLPFYWNGLSFYALSGGAPVAATGLRIQHIEVNINPLLAAMKWFNDGATTTTTSSLSDINSNGLIGSVNITHLAAANGTWDASFPALSDNTSAGPQSVTVDPVYFGVQFLDQAGANPVCLNMYMDPVSRPRQWSRTNQLTTRTFQLRAGFTASGTPKIPAVFSATISA